MARRIAYFAFAGIIAVGAGLLVHSVVRYQAVQIETLSRGQVSIVVAAKRVGAWTKIDETALRIVPWPREHLPPGALSDPGKAIGRITEVTLVENQPLVEDALLDQDKRTGLLPLMIPAGMRAMSIAVDEVADMAGFILPNTRVDVLASVETGNDALSERARIVLQDIQVAAVEKELESQEGQPQPAKVVTLLVTPRQAETLAVASRIGPLRLVMRNFGDSQIIATGGATATELIGEGASKSFSQIGTQRTVAVRPRPTRTLEIIRDGKRHQLLSFVAGNRVSSEDRAEGEAR